MKDDGTRFEIWFENLLVKAGYKGVRRNVKYSRKRYVYRQVDLEYMNYLSLFETFVILELKYSGNGNIGLKFRSEKKRKAGQLRKIENIVDEVEERRRFVMADHAILVTNRQFDKDVKKLAHKYNIKVYEKNHLEKLDRKRRFWLGKCVPIDHQIKNIDLRKYKRKTICDYVG